MNGDQLHSWRARRRMSRDELARLTGYSVGTIGRFEHGTDGIPVVFRLAVSAINAGLGPYSGAVTHPCPPPVRGTPARRAAAPHASEAG